MNKKQCVSCLVLLLLLHGAPLRAALPVPVESAQSEVEKTMKFSGRVRDALGEPLPGATVVIQGTTLAAATDAEGRFTLTCPQREKVVLVFSFIGMETLAVEVSDPSQPLDVRLQEAQASLSEIVVTGIFERKKESFTGSAATYTAKELKTMGSRNVLQSLKTLDPAFAIVESTEFGSDPNRLPNMEIRGKSSMLGLRDELEADPNQPLFILDGFESTLAAINDLDINRVASITILKDAASTAIYGSKAANGVVVVETVKPQAGKLQVNYKGNVNVSVPDLTGYNLMNAAEKLEFEQLAGRYNGDDIPSQIGKFDLLQDKIRAVARGVDTYWLAEPLRVGTNQSHSLYVQGGEGNFIFGLGGGYNGNSGVMKHSLREVVSGNIDLVYRKDKLQFSNKFSMNSTHMGNPTVSFAEFAGANPYFTKRTADGTVEKWLENNDYFRSPNPLYNQSLNSRDKGTNVGFSDFFVAEYMPVRELKVRARFGYTYGNQDAELFLSPDHTSFDDYEVTRKGRFTATHTRLNTYEGELSATFGKTFGKHQVNAVLGGNMYAHESLTQGYVAVGFPQGDFTYPSFSNGYPENGAPTYYESTSRSLNAYFNGGYVYDNRYLMDLSLRTSGTSLFGSSKKYNTTWSLGLGWNLHNERFISQNLPWVNFFKLRASVGNPGNQNFESGKTLLTYAFQYAAMNYFGMGASLNQIGNPNLEWQVTLDKNIGVDLTLLDKRVNFVFDYYNKTTDPLLIAIGMPYSSGTSQFLTNAGKQVAKGYTASLVGYLIQNFEDRISWSVRLNLRSQDYELKDIGNKLSGMNKAGKGANTVRYYDGSDPDDIWAVRSAGIDPSTGREVFLNKDGDFTYDFSYDDEVICGNARPKAEGIVGTSLTYKGLSISLNFRYQLGADLFNSAVFNKVENLSAASLNYNQDKRALYERWHKPGDMVRFKDIASAASTPMSSRFVQKENVFSLESLYVGYDWYNGWIRRLGLSSLTLSFSMRDVFRASTLRVERGTSYPFARTMEAGLSFNF